MSLRSRKDWLRHVLYGVCMGAADLVPGVSGGTMALICGIYERLIHAIRSLGTVDALSIFWLDFRRFETKVAWDFILALLLGIGFSFILFSQMIHFMLGDPDWRVYLYALFFGMILSSIVFCIRRVPNWDGRLWWGLAFGAAATLFFTGFRAEPLVNGKRYDVAIPAEFRYSGPKELVNYDSEKGLIKGVSEKELAAMWMKGYIEGSDKVYPDGEGASVPVSDVVKLAEYSWFDPWLVFCGAVAVSCPIIPLECAHWPVSRHARLPEHVGAAQNAWRNSSPWSASRWMFGVGTECPYGCT